MTRTPQTKADWIDRIEPLLNDSLEDVSERITSAAPVQRWLQEASFEAARDLGGASDMQAQAQAHAWMRDDLEATFPALVAAVDELTEGCGSLSLSWRPLQPSYSRVHITFDRDFEVDLFWRFSALDANQAQALLRQLRNNLPKGTPFPNRPNKATALAAHAGRSTGVRLLDYASETQKRWQTITLLPHDHEPIEKLAPTDAVDRLLRLLAAPDA